MSSWRVKKAPFRKYKSQVLKQAIRVCDFIYQVGESESLRNPCKDVSLEEIQTQNFQKKLKYLKSCLLRYRKLTGRGRGIAAVQVGIPEKFAVIYTPKELITIINPKITKVSKEKYKYPEMCMSANPVIVPLLRSAWIEFEYLDEKGKLQKWYKKDNTKQGKILNRVFQHEIDHMQGIINLDLGNPKEYILESDPKFYKRAKFEKI